MRMFGVALAMALVAGQAMANDVYGIWKSEPNEKGAFIHVEVGPCDAAPAKVCGRIIEAINGDPKRAKEIVGRYIIEGMEPDGENEWDDGTIWAPDDDETYSSDMELEGDTLSVSGCVLAGLICRSQDWTRVQ